MTSMSTRVTFGAVLAAAIATAVVSLPPRPSVVTSFLYETP